MKYFQNENMLRFLLTSFKVLTPMKNQTLKLTFFTVLFLLFLNGCTSSERIKLSVETFNSGGVVFSNITTNKTAKGIVVNGNVRKISSLFKRKRILGDIHIILTSKEGKALETMTARIYRKSHNSKTWYFDGLLKTLPPVDSKIIVKYII